MLLPTYLYAAVPTTVRYDLSSDNIAATFPSSPQLSGPANSIVQVEVVNLSNFELEVNCSSATQPSSNASNSFYVQANSAEQTPWTQMITVPLGKVCWLRSVNGTANVGTVTVTAWGY